MQTDQGLEVELLLPEQAVRVACHPISIRRILNNLSGNALRYGATRLQAELKDDGHWVRLRLSDNGPGIAEQDYSRVLKPFTQGNLARTGGGSGLGLAIVAKIVSQHHGTIKLGRSELGLAGGDPVTQASAAGVDGLRRAHLWMRPSALSGLWLGALAVALAVFELLDQQGGDDQRQPMGVAG